MSSTGARTRAALHTLGAQLSGLCTTRGDHLFSGDALIVLLCVWRAGVAAAARLSGGAAPLSTKKLPPSLDVFGWCTWDAFYSSVSAKGIQVCA